MNDKDRKEFLKSIKVGDEVCITNEYNMIESLFGSLLEESMKSSLVCEIHKVRGILDDGAIVIDDKIYNGDTGVYTSNHENEVNLEIQPVDEENRHQAWRETTSNILKKIDWFKISDEAIRGFIIIINEESERIKNERTTSADNKNS